jgi:hypothetical protein
MQYVLGICIAQKWEITVCYQGRVPGAGSTVKQLEENILHTYWLDSIFITFGNVYIRHVYSSAQGGYEIKTFTEN